MKCLIIVNSFGPQGLSPKSRGLSLLFAYPKLSTGNDLDNSGNLIFDRKAHIKVI